MNTAAQPELRWQDPDWLKQATAWIRAEARHAGLPVTGAIEQPHIYPWSTVMRVPTRDGMLFFKATAEETLREAAWTEALARWYPDCMPELVAVDAARGWMLMRHGGEPLRASIRPAKDLQPWFPVIRRYAEVQMGLSQRMPELLALGVPDWRLARLPGLYAQLLTDTEILRVDQPGGLTAQEYRRVQELAARFAEVCAALAAAGVPESLNHGDFHDGNVLVKNGRVTFFDWGDANVTHPFVSLRTFFVGIENSLELEDYSFTPEMDALLQRYLELWQPFASLETLLLAYRRSRCVAAIVKALAWHQTVAPLTGPLRKKYEHILPELFREFIFYEKMLPS